jgi:Flp pilus assembly protein TadB
VTFYDVLGVRRGAGAVELRQAYLRLVRDHHPDRHADATPEVREAAEARIRTINEAWHELGDPRRRARYDEQLDRAPRSAVIESEGARSWRPYDLDDDPTDERLDDSHRPAPRGGRVVSLGPPLVVSVGLALLVLGIALGARTLLALGAMVVVFGIGLFALAPMAVILESRQNDLH